MPNLFDFDRLSFDLPPSVPAAPGPPVAPDLDLELDPVLLKLAQSAVNQALAATEKTALDPALAAAGGGAAPPAPAPVPGAPPMPGPGGAPGAGGLDPNMLAQLAPMLGGGAAGGGKAGGKKAEQQLLDTKLWIIQYLLVQLCEHAGIKLPPSVVVGPPPDPMAMATAQQDQQLAQGAGAPMQDPAAAGGAGAGAGPGPVPPVPPMDPSSGPIGGAAGAIKQSAAWGEPGLEPPIGREWSQADTEALLGAAPPGAGESPAARARRLLGARS